ncbi:MAG: enoyl-CoA hydratase-related protein, partial [Thermodesulfobacteriota bacterium]
IETNTLQMEEGRHYRPASIFASVERWLTGRPGAKVNVPPDRAALIRDRLLGILFSQSFDIVDRGLGTRTDLNLGCQVALGFKKGPLDLMRDLGEAEVRRIMSEFERNRPGFPQSGQSFQTYLDFYRHILVDDIEGVKVITLRRPQAMNALNDEVNDEVLAVLKAHAGDPAVEGFVITGWGDQAFSAGADIGRFPSLLGDAVASAQYARGLAKVQVFMDHMDKPVVAALNGLALGGGLEIAIRCHSLVALSQARLGFPEITLGILPGIGGCVVPYRRWPQGAKLFDEMVCLGRNISAQEAFEAGMVSRLVDDMGDLYRAAAEEVRRLKGRLTRLPEGPITLPAFEPPETPRCGKQPLSHEAVALTVETIRTGARAASLAEALEAGYQGFGRIACTEAAQEGISAFLEKRRPNFTK